MIFSKPSGPAEYLIACLGNPGDQYTYTHHNAGFLFADYLADQNSFSFGKIKFRANYGTTEINGHRCIVMKPQTYMNDSGDAVKQCASFYKIPNEKVIVVFDDISLPFGKTRIRKKGSAGGHNGIKSIISHLGGDNFPRIKIGVGDRSDKDSDLKDFVLSDFSKAQMKEFPRVFDCCKQALELMVDGDFDTAMQKFN